MIHTPEPSEYPRIAEIYNNAITPFYEIYSQEEREAFADNLVETPESIAEQAAERELRVYKNPHGVIEGFAVFRIKNQEVVWIGSLYVDPGAQGKGVGATLLKYVESFTKEHRCLLVALETHRDALWAISFYTKHGYEIVNEKVGNYPYSKILDKPPVVGRPLFAKQI